MNVFIIQLSRQSTYHDMLIVGILYGNIEDGETKDIDIEDRYHSIYLKIDWRRSNEL
ncbi:hypothetical protein K2F41_09905 [Clostridium sp. CM027]|uniref:hypothetical protein n=1 Tax=Clostridium sp. CM027 TaxID=2849865 RepID=UPI001C6E681E|nr:hypothetical protein [Clostridium sp. CM027]MBW9145858.1 hypothetical protein [Clostridium sp. CM027]